MIEAHGGGLINQKLSEEERNQILQHSDNLPHLKLNEEQIKDVENICHGVYSPLTGFLRRGEIQNFTGISDPYEAPEKPAIHIKGDQMTVEQSAAEIVNYLRQNKLID